MIQPSIGKESIDISYNPPKTVANKFVEQFTSVEEEGVKKIVFNSGNFSFDVLRDSIPSEAAKMISQMIKQEMPEAKGHLPIEAQELMQQIANTGFIQPNEQEVGLVRKRSDELERAMNQIASVDRYQIDIENSTLTGLTLNKSTKTDVINEMKSMSKIDYNNNFQEAIFYYTDAGISFFFDENNVISEVEIDSKYKKTTTMGLKIGDPLERAIELYGTPRMKSAKGAIWNRFSILMEDRQNAIRLIRLKIRA
jgi:hypothetical protein